MSRRRQTPEQIITALREAEVGLANGKTVAMVSRELGISEQTYYRWRQESGGMKVDQARRFKELEKENARLKRAVANLTVDKLILEEPTKGNFRARAPTPGAWCMYVSDSGRVNVTLFTYWVSRARFSAGSEATWRRGGATHGRDTLGEPVRQLRVSPDHEPAAYRGLGGEPQVVSSVSGGRRG